MLTTSRIRDIIDPLLDADFSDVLSNSEMLSLSEKVAQALADEEPDYVLDDSEDLEDEDGED